MAHLLSVQGLVTTFRNEGKEFNAIEGVNLHVDRGEIVGIVGESGSGKSVTMLSVLQLIASPGRVAGGEVYLEGVEGNLLSYGKESETMRQVRGGRISMIFQEPMTSLNPVLTVGYQIQENVLLHTKLSPAEAKKRTIEAMKMVNIPDAESRYDYYPQQFSGGMRQRIMIAMAMAPNPDILIADEATTALDVTTQAQLLEMIRKIAKETNTAVIMVTHNLGLVARYAERIYVMYGGHMMETSTCKEIFHHTEHPYTRALLRALPQLGVKGQALFAIPGTPPNLYNDIQGDAFYPRNPEAMEIDRLEEPPMFSVSPGHTAKTWTMHPMAIQKWGDPRDYRTPGLGRAPAAPEPYTPRSDEPLLSVRDLSIDFGSGKKVFHAVNGVSFDVYRGETFSLVGESGSGKTTIGRAIMKIIPTAGGEILYKGTRVNRRFSREEIKQYRQQVQMIFQDPMASLNERAKVDYIISEGLYNFNLFENEADRKAKVSRVMQRVGLLPEFASRFPHEFSGGQRQRLGIARALIMEPEFIIADEPISALDVSIRAQIINLLNELKKEHSLTYLFIAHDLSVVRFISDRIGVIYKGALMELAPGEEIFAHPLHPYTRSLLSAIPMPDPAAERGKTCTPYNPSAHDYSVDKPAWTEIAPGHFVFANARECDEYRRMLG